MANSRSRLRKAVRALASRIPRIVAPRMISTVPPASGRVHCSPSHATATTPANSGEVFLSGEARATPTLEMAA